MSLLALLLLLDPNLSLDQLDASYRREARPLVQRYCAGCHGPKVAEADLDLTAFQDLNQVRAGVNVWIKVREMLDSGQMPPRDEPQPTREESQRLRNWVRDYLLYEARQAAGDPGQVVLRRLSNAEYTYTLRDLTAVPELDPAREFPVDGAAGEGFTNTGDALVMSPSLVQKYLDAAKQVAEHAMLLPDGFRFTKNVTRRDRIDDLLEQVRGFYRRYTVQAGGSEVNLQGVQFETNQGGRLPLQQYLSATLELRDMGSRDAQAIAAIAKAHGLQPKYLAALYDALIGETPRSFPLDDLRRQWRAAKPQDASSLASWIEGWQRALWEFNTVGQLGRDGGPKTWMSPSSRIAQRHDARIELPTTQDDIVLHLTARVCGSRDEKADVIWRNPRLEFPNHAPIPLRDVQALAAGAQRLQATELSRTASYLRSIAKLHDAGALDGDDDHRESSLHEAAQQNQLAPRMLRAWLSLTSPVKPPTPVVEGRFPNKLVKVQGYESINGWGSDEALSLLANQSAEPVTFLTLTVPARSVTLHPSPSKEAVIVWRSPISGGVRIEGLVADADDKCGNGAAWRVDVLAGNGLRTLAEGVIDNGGRSNFAIAEATQVQAGDLLRLNIGPRGGDHACDTTHVQWRISSVAGQQVWNLEEDVVDRILNGNPLPDRLGNGDVWHFCVGGETPAAKPLIPSDSSLAAWIATLRDEAAPERNARLDALASAVGNALAPKAPGQLSPANQQLRQTLYDWLGPLPWVNLASSSPLEAGAASPYGMSASLFAAGEGEPAAPQSNQLRLAAPHSLTVRLPAALASGAEFLVSGMLREDEDETTSTATSVQLHVALGEPSGDGVDPGLPLITSARPQAIPRLEAELDAFRRLFPAALCYTKIVPVDEVVTLTLYHREDEHLRRLMLEAQDVAELDRIWDELLYVAQEPLALVVAFEQISEFATQDRPDLVKAFAPMKPVILQRADAFRQRMVDAETIQLQAVVEFADRAWRRPLQDAESASLRRFYDRLRTEDLSHEDALRLTLARVLTSPAFLYRLERPATGEAPAPVDAYELASRLSYFLWSSTPDEELLASAASGELLKAEEWKRQTRRMLEDDRVRRLAIQFACQWLHVRDFDGNDDKNERLYPEFAELRGDMYEETVRFFDDLMRSNASVLSILDADHTFLNGKLAGHYGLAGAEDDPWRRVEGVRAQGRGGILGMATILASQSGASRTSPILRGNWVSETLLGERLPRPPANVPQLPESLPNGLTARELIERHTADAACAKCHERIDPYGFALEQYDAIGRARPEPANTRTKLLDGSELEGLDGLRSYLVGQRREDFLRQFCRKLLGFSLGREVRLADELLLMEMMTRLREADYGFAAAVDAIVASPQFRMIRPAGFVATME